MMRRPLSSTIGPRPRSSKGGSAGSDPAFGFQWAQKWPPIVWNSVGGPNRVLVAFRKTGMCQPTTHRVVRSVFCPPPHHPPECRAEPPLSARIGGGSSPPPPSGGIALECSTAPVVVPRSTRFSRRFAGFSVEPPASARRRHQPGECESMGAQVPGAAFVCISKLSDALSVRGDKKYAMRCRKKPRDALSVRRYAREALCGFCPFVATEHSRSIKPYFHARCLPAARAARPARGRRGYAR